MITEKEENRIQIEPSDWRWSASIVGLSKYFDFNNIKYRVEDDYIEFDKSEINKEKYLNFVEWYFMDKMHHKVIENLLEIENPTEEQIKLINEKIKNKNGASNTIVKNILGDFDYKVTNKIEITEEINKNRATLIENTYINGKALYANFSKGNLFDEKGIVCRIIGYYVDKGRKMRALSFGADKSNFVCDDSIYFDFIPFGFSKTREAFFINNNFTIEQLIKTNKVDLMMKEELNISNLLYRVKESADYIDYDVEIIKKDRDLDYFETVYIRKKAIEIFKKLDDDILEIIKKPCNGKKSEKAQESWIGIEKIVTNSILNNLKLDDIIENLIKAYNNHKYLLSHLIKINQLIYGGGKEMTFKQKKAYDSAVAVRTALSSKKNKIRSYEQRLISSISLRDYEKVQETLLHLSAYTQVEMEFLIDVFADFEENKNLVYTFINALGEKNKNTTTKIEGEDK